jgi:hypothetical protein
MGFSLREFVGLSQKIITSSEDYRPRFREKWMAALGWSGMRERRVLKSSGGGLPRRGQHQKNIDNRTPELIV